MLKLSINPTPVLSNFVEFEDINYIVDEHGKPWFTASEIGKHLGYADPARSINRIYARRKNELESHTCVVNLTPQVQDSEYTSSVNLTPQGQTREHRIFNKRATRMIAMFADTEKAVEFRTRLLDLLDAIDDGIFQKAFRDYYRQGILDSLYTHLPEKRLMRAEQSVMLSGDGMTHKHASDLLGCHPSTVAKDKKVFSYIFGEDEPEPSGTLGVVKKHIDGTANENTYIEGKE